MSCKFSMQIATLQALTLFHGYMLFKLYLERYLQCVLKPTMYNNYAQIYVM